MPAKPSAVPGVLETLAFAPFPATELPWLARTDLPGIQLIETPSSYIRVRSGGQGRDAVLLSDGPSTVEHYDQILALLGRDMRLHVMEIPGFGFSWATDPDALTFDGTVAAIGQAMTAVVSGPAVVVGLCVQAHIAMVLADRFPHLCNGIVLAQATGWEQTQTWAAKTIDPRGLLSEPWQGQITWRTNRERASIDGWYRQASAPGYDVGPWQKTAREVLRSGASNSLPTLLQTWYSGPSPLRALDVPATLLWGDADPTHIAAHSDPWALSAHLPAATRATIHGAGHFLDLEAPGRLRDAIVSTRS